MLQFLRVQTEKLLTYFILDFGHTAEVNSAFVIKFGIQTGFSISQNENLKRSFEIKSTKKQSINLTVARLPEDVNDDNDDEQNLYFHILMSVEQFHLSFNYFEKEDHQLIESRQDLNAKTNKFTNQCQEKK